jgi:hypothetical protein
MDIFCCTCEQDVQARLTNGEEIYPHRKDLSDLPFWVCDTCGNYVGCHHKTKNPTQPLGIIPSSEIRNARQHIHKILDPIWKSGRTTRKALYADLTERLGWKYHTSCIRSVEEAREVWKQVKDIDRAIPW